MGWSVRGGSVKWSDELVHKVVRGGGPWTRGQCFIVSLSYPHKETRI